MPADLPATKTVAIYMEIADERDRQDKMFGSEHDDQHSHEYWLTLVAKHIGRQAHCVLLFHDPSPLGGEQGRYTEILRQSLRRGLIMVAATVVAWIEAIDRSGVGEPAESAPTTPQEPPSGDPGPQTS